MFGKVRRKSDTLLTYARYYTMYASVCGSVSSSRKDGIVIGEMEGKESTCAPT
jgi:hypothetical protein